MSYLRIQGGEVSGSIGDKTIDTTKQETSGSIGVRRAQHPGVQLNTLDRDTVCFQGREKDKGASFLGVLAKLGITAAAIVGGLGLAKKYNYIDKISHDGFRKFVDNYLANPSYKACRYVKSAAGSCYDKTLKFLHIKK